jgi:predicted Ser/Thr protein kinase
LSKGAQRILLLHQERKAQKQQEAAAAAAAMAKIAATPAPAGLKLGQDEQGRLLVNGRPAKQLSKGNYGDTYKVDTSDGPVLVKVDRLQNGDPQEDDPGVSREQQRLNMAVREMDNLRRAAALGVGPEPVGEVVKLPADGRYAIAYKMVDGAPLKASFSSTEPNTSQAVAILSQPGALERLDAGVLRIARAMADAGLEHGDLHGANIVVRPDGSPVLIDWGIGGQDPPGASANRAQLEARLLLQMNYYTQTLNRHSSDGKAVAEGLGKRLDQAMLGLRAASDLQGKFDLEWEENNLTGDNFMPRMREARRLRAQGLGNDAAQREAGVLPRITPEMERATAAARDEKFNDADLAEMRSWLDQQVLGAGQ